jgi:hypothetical protein
MQEGRFEINHVHFPTFTIKYISMYCINIMLKHFKLHPQIKFI